MRSVAYKTARSKLLAVAELLPVNGNNKPMVMELPAGSSLPEHPLASELSRAVAATAPRWSKRRRAFESCFTCVPASISVFELEEYLGTGDWHPYEVIEVAPGRATRHDFPAGHPARWVRVKADQACRATAIFLYE